MRSRSSSSPWWCGSSATRPTRTDALETAARAVLEILTDDRSLGEGEWAQAMADWQDARIRKVVRRARGAEWRRAGTLPGSP
ncbi:hypothetical protein SNARM312S_06748 [Streptomyces narbonensis]